MNGVMKFLVIASISFFGTQVSAQTQTYALSQNGHPLYVVTDGQRLEEESMRMGTSDEYVFMSYTICETKESAPVLHGTPELNATAIFGGYCDYQIFIASRKKLTDVTMICSLRTGEAITYDGPDGLSGISQRIDASPLMKQSAGCPIVTNEWKGFSASVPAGAAIARMPLVISDSSVITAGWINHKFTFLVLDTGATTTSFNFSEFSVTPTGKGDFILADGSHTTFSLGTTSFCYVGTLCTPMEASDAPPSAAPLLGLSFLSNFDKVTINIADSTLDLVPKQ